MNKKQISVSFSNEEIMYLKILSNDQNMSLSRFIHNLIFQNLNFSSKIKLNNQYIKTLKDLRRDFYGVVINLNQIAKFVNTNHKELNENISKQIIKTNKEINILTKKIRQVLL
jgi:hypothetical protein